MGSNIMQHSQFEQRNQRRPNEDQINFSQNLRSSRYERSDFSTSGSIPPNDRATTFVRLGVGFASVLSEHVLSHPCIVLRRQCQVHHDSIWHHLTPFTLFQTIFYVQRHQKTLTTLWKGIGSTLMVKGMAVCTESAISEFTPLPKDITRHSSLKKISQHLFLKTLSFAVITPFYAASLVETVQSEIASEQPGVFDCLKDGFSRIMSLGSPPSTRLLPVWKLFFPTVLYGVSHYVIASLARYTVVLSMKSEIIDSQLHHESEISNNTQQSAYASFYPELLATFTGSLLADITLYPLETILHRLCMQGTRTIIDNTDTGLGVVPIITRYEGTLDCLKSIISEEGFSGLYKGFGALVLQYCMHVAVLRLAKFLLDAFSNRDNPKPILGSELAKQQEQELFRMAIQQGRDAGNRDLDTSNVSFRFNDSHATSTPNDTPQGIRTRYTGPTAGQGLASEHGKFS